MAYRAPLSLVLGLLLSFSVTALADEPAAPPAAANPEPAAKAKEDDVSPTATIYSSDRFDIAFGALVQLFVAPYAGDDALVDNGDPVTRAGFRLRRARLGFETHFGNHKDLDLLIVLNPLQSDAEVGSVSDARLTWTPNDWAAIWAGATKVPYTHGEIVSSAELTGIERPLSVQTIVPQNRLGLGADFWLVGKSLRLTLGVFNATEGYDNGNTLTGLLGVGRVEWTLNLGGGHLTLGAGGFAENAATATVFAGSFSAGLDVGPITFFAEGLCDRSTPTDAPPATPAISDHTTRCGAYAEAGYRFTASPDLRLVVRGEWIDDNTSVDDAGDAILVDAGFNYRPHANLRFQLHYVGRYERFGVSRANDTVVLNIQADI